MNEDTMAGLMAYLDGMSVDQIVEALSSSSNADAFGDIPTVARYLFAKSTGAI